MKRNSILGIIGTLLVAVVSITVPEFAINYEVEKKIGVVQKDSAKYYTPQFVEGKLDLEKCTRLITGEWENIETELDYREEKTSLTRNDVIEIACDQTLNLYTKGLYPSNINSGFKRWYTPTVTLYRYTDKNYEKYSCLVWKVVLEKYDHSEIHTILVEDQSGAVIAGKAEGNLFKSHEVNLNGWANRVGKHWENIQNLRYSLNLSNTDIYLPEYGLHKNGMWDIMYVCLVSGSKVQDYDSAVKEARENISNTKFFYRQSYSENGFMFELLPFVVSQETE